MLVDDDQAGERRRGPGRRRPTRRRRTRTWPTTDEGRADQGAARGHARAARPPSRRSRTASWSPTGPVDAAGRGHRAGDHRRRGPTRSADRRRSRRCRRRSRSRPGAAGSFKVTPSMIADSITFAAEDGDPGARSWTPAKLRTDADAGGREGRAEEAEGRDRHASSTGKPKVVPAVNGTSVSRRRPGEGRRAGADQEGQRSAPVVGRADRSQGQVLHRGRPASSGIKEVTGEFTTNFPYAAYRNVNIGRAAELINGTVLKPGETFSLNGIVGERTAANGFVEGFIIQGGKFKRGAGRRRLAERDDDVQRDVLRRPARTSQHQPHTLYIDRYPAGPGGDGGLAEPGPEVPERHRVRRAGAGVREEGVAGPPGLDHGEDVVDQDLRRGRGHQACRSPTSPPAATSTDDSPDCEPQAPVQGFDVSYARLFYRRRQGRQARELLLALRPDRPGHLH